MDSNVQAMPQDLNGKSAFIVGASRGIGRAIVEEYADRGANVAIAARSVDDLETLAATVTDRVCSDQVRYLQRRSRRTRCNDRH